MRRLLTGIRALTGLLLLLTVCCTRQGPDTPRTEVNPPPPPPAEQPPKEKTPPAKPLPPKEPVHTAEEQRILKLIEQLGAEEFDTRNSAQIKLLEFGDAAVPFLRRRALTRNLETRGRVKKLLKQIGVQGIEILPAEFSAQGGGTVATDPNRTGAKNTIIFNWDNTGHWLEWNVEDARPGDYEVRLRYSTDTESPRKLEVNGKPAPGLEKWQLAPTGGWNNWKEARLPATVKLKAGHNKIRMTSLGGNGLNLDLIVLKWVGKKGKK